MVIVFWNTLYVNALHFCSKTDSPRACNQAATAWYEFQSTGNQKHIGLPKSVYGAKLDINKASSVRKLVLLPTYLLI